jgi:hypothetical protein
MNESKQTYPPHSIRTFSGKYFSFSEMDPDTIDIKDIAHALSHIPRFTGHTREPYSVGQHSIMACLAAADSAVKLDALLHDATEAYMNDIAKPLKDMLPDYKAMEKRLFGVIAEKFGLLDPMDAEVKNIDHWLLWNEFRSVVTGPAAPYAWPAADVKRVFLELYHQYKRK